MADRKSSKGAQSVSSSSASSAAASQKLGAGDEAGGGGKNVQSSVTCVYQTHIGGYWRNATVVWCKNVTNHSLSVSVDSVETEDHSTCKVDLKPWQFWTKRGYKTMEVDGNRLEAYWDFRSAKFSGGPEPVSDFYVALVSDQEMVLFLGDYKKKAYKRTKSRPPLVEAALFYKKEHVFGKKSFTSRAKFDRTKKDSEIVVESSAWGPRDPEMWISIDGIVLIHIQNLQWKFRGNQTVTVNKVPVQVFWDVHDWLFRTSGSTHGLFIFKPVVAPESDSDVEDGGGGDDDGDSVSSGGSKYYSTRSHSTGSQFCLLLYAWKLE
ncbi:uncharacterized protein LOC115996177 [Ipomoea triloba]|uniref:uncharacterized protein LOC115996177 n=1 Tax=Ipomoea triloba TaxID=35885 RepID=UPI00125E8F59|nr:uncharacterized protein LOC115996177 [Ipomoea triloba]